MSSLTFKSDGNMNTLGTNPSAGLNTATNPQATDKKFPTFGQGLNPGVSMGTNLNPSNKTNITQSSGMAPTNQTFTSTAFFGASNTTAPSFGKQTLGTGSGGNYPLMQYPQGGIGAMATTTMPSMTNMTTSSTQQNPKRESEKHDMMTVMQNYLNAISPSHPANMFKYIVYNRAPQGYDVNLLQNYHKVEKTEEGTGNLIDYNLWVKAIQNNPNPALYFPHQLSSPSQLVFRTKKTEVLEFHVLETIMTLQNNLNQLNNTYDNDIENEISSIKRKMQLIKMKKLAVITKMERLTLLIGKAEKNFQMENVLINKLNNLKSILTEENEYTNKIKELSSMSMLISLDSPLGEDRDYMKGMDNTRMEKNINILRDMKNIIDVTFNSLRQNTAIINGIKGDLDNLKKYGKIPK